MSPSTDKYHVTGVGCASAVPLLRLAAQTLQGDASQKVLVVAAESMSSILMPARADDPRAKTVGSAIFGDGCAAALLSGGGSSGPAILASRVHQIPNTLDAVTLESDAGDSHLDLARDLPEIAGEELADLVVAFLHSTGLKERDIAHWMLHPGGQADPGARPRRPWVARRGHRGQLARARRARERRHPVDLLRAPPHDQGAQSRPWRARPGGHDRSRRVRRADAARVLGARPKRHLPAGPSGRAGGLAGAVGSLP